MRPKQEIERLRGEVERLQAMLSLANSRLRSQGLGQVTHVEPWAIGLTQQQASAMQSLITAYPRCLDMFDLDDAVPHNDHAADRNVQAMAKTLVFTLRKKLGATAIETRGKGYRASPAFMECYNVTRQTTSPLRACMKG